MTSMAELLSEPVDLEMVQYSLVYHFGRGMGFHMVETDLSGDPAANLATVD